MTKSKSKSKPLTLKDLAKDVQGLRAKFMELEDKLTPKLDNLDKDVVGPLSYKWNNLCPSCGKSGMELHLKIRSGASDGIQPPHDQWFSCKCGWWGWLYPEYHKDDIFNGLREVKSERESGWYVIWTKGYPKVMYWLNGKLINKPNGKWFPDSRCEDKEELPNPPTESTIIRIEPPKGSE